MIPSEGSRPCRCRDCACGPGHAAESLLQLKSGTRDAAGADMHPGQLAVSPDTLRELVDAQFPQWRALAIKPVGSQGTLIAIFRIGDHFAARLPLEPGDPGPARQHLESDARTARELARRTRFPTPEPVALGNPGAGYLLPWLVQTWLPGVTATDQDPGGSAAFAHDLAEFIGGVRAISTGGQTFSGSGRGGDLASHDAWMQTCFARSAQLPDVPRLRRMCDFPPGTAARRGRGRDEAR